MMRRRLARNWQALHAVTDRPATYDKAVLFRELLYELLVRVQAFNDTL